MISCRGCSGLRCTNRTILVYPGRCPGLCDCWAFSQFITTLFVLADSNTYKYIKVLKVARYLHIKEEYLHGTIAIYFSVHLNILVSSVAQRMVPIILLEGPNLSVQKLGRLEMNS